MTSAQAAHFFSATLAPYTYNVDLNPALDRLAPLRHGKIGYLFAVGLIAAAVAATAAAQALFKPTAAVVIFSIAVAICTALFGLAAGFVSAGLGALALDYFFIPPSFTLNMDRATLRVAIAFVTLAACTHLVERRISAQIRRGKKAPLGFHGHLDGIVDGEVYGWAMNADDLLSPVLVTILIDNRPAAEVAAVWYRPDLETNMQSSGRHGFYVDLGTRIPASKEVSIEAELLNGQRLRNSPQRALIPARATAQSPAVLFMHIPKTAGIAFREAITPNYRESEIAYLYGTPPGFLTGDLRRIPLEQRRAFQFVIGHFQYGVHDLLPQDSIYIAIVREPAARMLSHYRFLQHTEPAITRHAGRSLDFEELLATKPHIHFDNPLVRHFGSIDEREYPPGAVNEELYQKALYYLRTGFTFIGHQEFAPEAYAALQERFHWTARPHLELVNLGVARDTASQHLSRMRAAIEKHNPWDCRLYQEILRIFPYPK